MATRGRPRRPVTLSGEHIDRLIDRLREVILSDAESASVKNRARMVLACLEGQSNKEVAVSFGSGEHTISKWRTRFLNAGVPGLRDKLRPGAPQTVSERIFEKLAEIGAQPLGARPGATAAASLFGISRSTVTRAWKHARENAMHATSDVDHVRGQTRLEIVGIYLGRGIKIIAVSPQERPSIADFPGETRTPPVSDVRMLPEAIVTLLVSLARVAAASRMNKATDSILAFVDEMRAVSSVHTVHLLCFGERADWMEHVASNSQGTLKAYSFNDFGPWQEAIERALKVRMAGGSMSDEVLVSLELLATMRKYMSGDEALPPATCFSWSTLRSHHSRQPQATEIEQRGIKKRLKTDRPINHGKDVELAFYMAPVGLLISRQRVVDKYNQAFCGMFGYAMDGLAGKSLELLYPSRDEFDHVGEKALVVMRDTGYYSDERIMRRVDDSLFWCHVSGRAIDRNDPFAAAVWTFEDLSSVRPVTTDLTTRERQIAQFLVNGKSSKQIAKDLNISHRTVEAHRARLMRKYSVGTTSELIAHLIGRGSG